MGVISIHDGHIWRGFQQTHSGSIKRKFEELIWASSGKTTMLELTKGSSAPIAFYKEKLPSGAANSTIPLLIHDRMANFDVWHILVNKEAPSTSCTPSCSPPYNYMRAISPRT